MNGFVPLDVGDLDPVIDLESTHQLDEVLGVTGWHHDVHRTVQAARFGPEIEVVAAFVQFDHGIELVKFLGHHLINLVPKQRPQIFQLSKNSINLLTK